ncbi:helix-turn-helix domain-containing protein [Anderseniella sp. Alg231-50]|uniref:helix-turn-helix domain-containing protein n=1 Tax=Anderseniella sp. Alg231-50 TaxID=1922226 RepID=UPI00307C25C3
MHTGPLLDCYYFSYSHNMKLNAVTENPHYWIAVAVQGNAADRLSAVPILTRLASPGAEDPFIVRENQGMLGVRLDGSKFHCFAEDWLGTHLSRSISFTPDFRLRNPAERGVANLLLRAAQRDDEDPFALSEMQVQTNLFQSIATTLLALHPHSASQRIPQLRQGPSSKDIRRVIDYIRANLDTDMTLSNLVEVSGVPGRTLNHHFQRFVGQSPMAYLRAARLEAIHNGLVLGRFDSVAAAATRYRFGALGRFSRQYYCRFGELPSATLARRGWHA